MSGTAAARLWLARWWSMCMTRMRLRRACFVASGAAPLICRLAATFLYFSTLYAAAGRGMQGRPHPPTPQWACAYGCVAQNLLHYKYVGAVYVPVISCTRARGYGAGQALRL